MSNNVSGEVMTTPLRPAAQRPTAPSHLPLRFGTFRPAAFASAVRERREICGLSHEALATLAGLSALEVAAIEDGHALPALDALWALADALWVDAADLLHDARRVAERLAVESYANR